MELKRTPLFETHKALFAKLVDFGGWEMPAWYTQVIKEHTNTRKRAGLFDVSHMGELLVTGSDARECLNMLITNDISAAPAKKIVYSPVTNENGGVVDDLLIYVINDEEFLLIVNAGNTDKDFKWFSEKLSGGAVKLENVSTKYGQLALQGPFSQAILQTLVTFNLDEIKFFFFENLNIGGKKVIVSRTGYTGEDGFEIYCSSTDTVELWDAIMTAGKEYGICPVGLGARDTLRFEAALPLYGHEMDDSISPVEAGLKFFVKPGKGKFPGNKILSEQIKNGSQKTLVGIELLDKGIPRENYRIERDGLDVGYVTSGTFSPTFEKGLAMALVLSEFSSLGTELDIVARNKRLKARTVKLPFYKKKTLQK